MQQAPPKKSNTTLIVLLAVLLPLAFIACCCGSAFILPYFASSVAPSTPNPNALSETGASYGHLYEIVQEDTLRDTKRSLDVQLTDRVDEATLRMIALELKGLDSTEYDRTFIAYYLPGMEIGTVAWATTHFDPNLKVEILGMTQQELDALSAPDPSIGGRETLGRWVDESPITGGSLTIYRENGQIYIRQTFQDGSSSVEELRESIVPSGRKFDLVDGSSFGDHWILNGRGELECHDNDGLIYTARKIE